MSDLVWGALCVVGLGLVVILGWLLSAGNRPDPRLIDLDDEW